MTQHTEDRTSNNSGKQNDDNPQDNAQGNNQGGQGGGHGNDRDITVTISAPNNESLEFDVSAHDRVDKVAREAVKAFVKANQMESMDCSLALVIDGVASLLDDTARVEETAVHEHSHLVLVPKQTKTDG